MKFISVRSILSLGCIAIASTSVVAAYDNAPDGGTRYGDENQICPTYATIISSSYQYLVRQANQGTSDAGYQYYFTQPSLFKYGAGQWLWDSCGAIIANAHRNIDNAKLEFRTLMNSQKSDGMVPEEISWPSGSGNEVSQMPTIPWALQAIYRQSGDVDFLKEMVPKVAAYFDWWRTTRDIDSNGLITTIHPWESGIDASPAYDAPWHFTELATPALSYVVLYLKFPELKTYYKDTWDWDVAKILKRKSAESSLIANWFMVQDVAMNTLHAVGWAVLGDLASVYDKTAAATYYSYNKVAEASIQKNMWRSDLKQFVTCYRDQDGTNKQSSVQTIQSLFPLLLRSLTSDQKNALISDTTNANKFWTNYPFPSVSKSESSYQPKYTVNLLWRGPSWGFTNWFVIEGLVYQNRTDIASIAVDRWASAVTSGGGIWEMWNPDTAYGYGAEGLGMSSTIVDWLYRLKKVSSTNDYSGNTTALWKPDSEGSASGGSGFDEQFWVQAYGKNAVVDQISLKGGDRLDQISFLYGDSRSSDSYTQTHGGTGGTAVSLTVPRSAYISQLISCIGIKGGGRRVFYVKFTLSNGQSVTAGKTTDTCYTYTPPSGQRILGIYGRAGDEVDNIGVIGYY